MLILCCTVNLFPSVKYNTEKYVVCLLHCKRKQISSVGYNNAGTNDRFCNSLMVKKFKKSCLNTMMNYQWQRISGCGSDYKTKKLVILRPKTF